MNQVQIRSAPVSNETSGSTSAASPSPNGPTGTRPGALMGLDPSVPMRAYLGPRNGATQSGMRP